MSREHWHWRDVILQSNDFVTIFITTNPFHKSDNQWLQLFAAYFLYEVQVEDKTTTEYLFFVAALAHSLIFVTSANLLGLKLKIALVS